MKHYLDITAECCPMTLVKVKLKLAQMEKGDTVEVLLLEGEPLDNVPRGAEEQGFRVIATESAGGGAYRVVIEK